MLAPPLLAQTPVPGRTSPAVSGPSYNLSLGYVYLTMPIAGQQRVTLNGMDFSAGLDFRPHWGVVLDTSYARTSDLLGTKHMGYVLASQIGPVFYPVAHQNTRVFVRALGGIGLVDGAVPISGTRTFHGWEADLAWAGGAGIERAISGPFAARVTGDYLRTSFFDSTGAVHPQNDFRLTVGFVFRIKNQRY